MTDIAEQPPVDETDDPLTAPTVVPMPTVGRIVFVVTPHWGSGLQNPAVITRVIDATTINVMLFPDGGVPQAVANVQRKDVAPLDGVTSTWLWPPRD